MMPVYVSLRKMTISSTKKQSKNFVPEFGFSSRNRLGTFDIRGAALLWSMYTTQPVEIFYEIKRLIFMKEIFISENMCFCKQYFWHSFSDTELCDQEGCELFLNSFLYIPVYLSPRSFITSIRHKRTHFDLCSI